MNVRLPLVERLLAELQRLTPENVEEWIAAGCLPVEEGEKVIGTLPENLKALFRIFEEEDLNVTEADFRSFTGNKQLGKSFPSDKARKDLLGALLHLEVANFFGLDFETGFDVREGGVLVEIPQEDAFWKVSPKSFADLVAQAETFKEGGSQEEPKCVEHPTSQPEDKTCAD